MPRHWRGLQPCDRSCPEGNVAAIRPLQRRACAGLVVISNCHGGGMGGATSEREPGHDPGAGRHCSRGICAAAGRDTFTQRYAGGAGVFRGVRCAADCDGTIAARAGLGVFSTFCKRRPRPSIAQPRDAISGRSLCRGCRAAMNRISRGEADTQLHCACN